MVHERANGSGIAVVFVSWLDSAILTSIHANFHIVFGTETLLVEYVWYVNLHTILTVDLPIWIQGPTSKVLWNFARNLGMNVVSGLVAGASHVSPPSQVNTGHLPTWDLKSNSHTFLGGSDRRDRYNKKLKKYYVVYEENDEELSEDEEAIHQRDVEAPHIWFPVSCHENPFFPAIAPNLRWPMTMSRSNVLAIALCVMRASRKMSQRRKNRPTRLTPLQRRPRVM